MNNIIELINKYKRIIISTHSAPDMDAYGSSAGLYYSFKNSFKDKEVFLSIFNNGSNIFSLDVSILDKDYYKDALVIMTDVSSEEMFQNDYYKYAKDLIFIDHHEPNKLITNNYIIKCDYSSASEVVAEFIKDNNLYIDSLISNLLYSGIVSDSNRFYYKGTSSNTFKIASFLLENNADIIDIYKRMEKKEPLNKKLFKGYILSNIKVSGNTAYVYIKKDILDKYNVDALYSSRGCIYLLSGINDIDNWVIASEIDDKSVVIEFRSNKYNLVNIAKSLCGGGHKLARGATYDKTKFDFNEIIEKVKNNGEIDE